ncbi:hypothetical protein MTO96_021139 [Rhipicephalus appendiculatus]
MKTEGAIGSGTIPRERRISSSLNAPPKKRRDCSGPRNLCQLSCGRRKEARDCSYVTSPAPSFSNCIAYWGQKDDWTAAIVGLAVGKACILARDTSYLVDHRNLVAAASRDAFVESANTLILRALGEGVLALLPDVNPDDCMVAHVIVVIVGVFIILEGEMRRLQLYRTCHPAPPAGYNRAKYAYRASIVSFVVMGGYGGGKAILSSPHGHGRRRRRDSMVGYSSWEEKRA